MNFKSIMSGLLILCAGVLSASAELKQREWNVGGVARQALVWIPESSGSPAPLIFAFHGHGGSMTGAAREFAIHKLWPEAVVVYMQGVPTPGIIHDPEGKQPGWQKDVGSQDDRDLKFFDAVLISLQKEFRIDPKRIYCTGHSNGGSFAYLLWAARGDVFAAVAPVAPPPIDSIKNLKPKPALQVAGKKDPSVKYEWQEQTMRTVRTLNGCAETGVPWATSGDVTGTLYPSPAGMPFVSLIHPGGHKIPAEAPALIVRFFKENARK